MEIDSQPSETKVPNIIAEKFKIQGEPNSSEDEGIFFTRKPAPKLDIQSAKTSPPPKIASSPRPNAMLSDDSDDEDFNRSKTTGRRKLAVLSDDEEDGDGENGSKLAPVEPKRSALIASDSEEETETIFKKRIQQRPSSDSEGSDSDAGEAPVRPSSRSSGSSVAKPAFKYNSDIFDTEISDDDDQHRPASPVYSDEETKPVNKKRKDKRPSAKEREANVRAIHSESQRMVRESEIVLPYHRPKQRSLSEFLSRRKKATPPQFTSRGSIKMSMRNIDTLRLLEQKKREVEEFYKSDSDHEDPEDADWTPDQEESKVDDETPKAKPEERSEDLTLVKEPVSSVAEDEEEDLPDLIIERTPKSKAVDSGVAESLANLEERVDNEQNCELANNTDKVNDSGIQSGSSSPTEDPQVERDSAAEGSSSFPQKENLPEENMECSEVDEETYREAGTNMKHNQKAQELEEAVQGVSFEEDQLINDTEAVSAVSGKTDNVPKLATPKLSKLVAKIPDLDLSKIAMSTPKLSIGGEDDFIDLEEEDRVTPRNFSGMYDLMNRFVKHSNTKRQLAGKQQVKLSIVSKEKDALGKEKLVASNLVVDVEAEEDTRPSEAVPGAGMIKLKSALQAKIREKREQERIRRVKEREFLETEQVMHDYHDDGTLPNEEDEFTDQSETEYETESEPEENDIIVKDKKRKKSAYVDDEAEEDESEEETERDNASNAAGIKDENSNDTVDLLNLNDKDDDDADDDGEKLRLQWEDTQDVNALSRTASIARVASHDQDMFVSQSLKKGESLEKDTSIASMDSSFELFGSVIPAHQPGGGLKRASRDRQSESEQEAGFLTPLTKSKSCLFDSSMKERDLSLPIENSQDLFNLSTSENSSAFPANCPMNLHLTPIADSQFPQQESSTEKGGAVAKFKLDFTGLNTNENHEDDLLDLCSGKFTGNNSPKGIDGLCEDDLSPTQDINDLMGLCSGQFTSQAKGDSSQSFKMPAVFSSFTKSESKTSGADEDELLNLCSGTFATQRHKEEDSASTSGMVSNKKDQDLKSDREENDSSAEPEMIIDSTDDERQKERKPSVKRTRKKRRRIIAFSDDEDAQDGVEYDDDEDTLETLEYDDDEEVVKPRTTFSGFKDRLKGGIRADFLENEAELSETDHEVSDDEDERGQDILELEEADMEEYDEDDLRDQVGRAHLKSLLDSDKREVRLLQEMYLEDGELHGEGRQRRFRWKNVDDDEEENKRILSDDEGGNEEENEDAEWRKERFEREKFLQEQKEKVENSGNEVFKLDKKPLLRTLSKTSEVGCGRDPLKEANPAPVAVGSSTNETSAINPYSILKKKGSFLSRDKNTLARIAELTKDKSTALSAAKQTGNFVFQHLTTEEIQEKEELNKKLKKTHSLPTAKRAKIDRSFFSMDASSQSSSIFSQLL